MRRLSFFTTAPVLALTLALVTLPSYSVQAATYYVDDDPASGCPGDGSAAQPYCAIQAGINAASSGDTVEVAAGTYYENITMKSGVVIQGAGQGVSIIDGGENGSVVTATDVDSAAKLDGFTITNGKATEYGGGMFNSNSSPTVSNCTFSGNSAILFVGVGDGGGMYNAGSSPTVINCTFSGNDAGGRGGGMYNANSSATVTNCTFSDNTAEQGGGMYNVQSSPAVTNCTFSGNSNANYTAGGGMVNEDSSPTVTGCSFFNNSAGTFGGGMYNHSNSSPLVTSCIFSGNSAGHSSGEGGGGMSNLGSSPTVTNCIFSENFGYRGGGMSNRSSSPTVTNCTFSRNSASLGGGIYNESNSSVSVTNSILWGTTALESIFNFDTSSCSATYSNIEWGTATYPGTGNINADPMFVDPDGQDNIPGNEDDDYHLLAVSPCIDAGTSSGAPNADFEGDPRPQGAGYDMGADEYVQLGANFSAAPTRGPAPLTVSFRDLSTGTVNSWNWSFGDGTTSTERNPSHTYNESGSYTVSLTVTGPEGSDTETKADYIKVRPPAKAMPWIPLLLLDD